MDPHRTGKSGGIKRRPPHTTPEVTDSKICVVLGRKDKRIQFISNEPIEMSYKWSCAYSIKA